MQTAITFTGTPDEIASILEAINGGGTGSSTTATAVKTGKTPKRLTAAALADKSFADLKEIAEGLDVDTKGKKSAGLRKAILDAQNAEEEDEEEEEEEESDEDEDEDWEDEDEEEGDDEDEEEEEEEEEEPEPPKRRGRPAKKAAAPARKAPARRRSR